MKLRIEEVKDGVKLLMSEPFQGFLTDCDHCEYFFTTPMMNPGGECTKHGFDCGVGCTCKDFKERW